MCKVITTYTNDFDLNTPTTHTSSNHPTYRIKSISTCGMVNQDDFWSEFGICIILGSLYILGFIIILLG